MSEQITVVWAGREVAIRATMDRVPWATWRVGDVELRRHVSRGVEYVKPWEAIVQIPESMPGGGEDLCDFADTAQGALDKLSEQLRKISAWALVLLNESGGGDAKEDPVFLEPDWFSGRIPSWERFLLPMRGQPVHLLEIGSYEGRSACWMAENVLQHPMSSLTCVDPCDNGAVSERLESNLRLRRHRGKVTLFKGLSGEALPYLMIWRRTFDFVYIDGSHVAPDVLFDAVCAFQLLRPGGLMCVDDYEWSPGHLDGTVRAPQAAINAFASIYAERAEVIHIDVQAWVRKAIHAQEAAPDAR